MECEREPNRVARAVCVSAGLRKTIRLQEQFEASGIPMRHPDDCSALFILFLSLGPLSDAKQQIPRER
ncbi:hypothetical protein EYF80_057783 [Liparis tanakae]|uniref:Uncharacterized protein n=1 Tax=Liparis tanakae TaxID=230148 RepID=A0A4Z2ET10_9TELE|nr:hypothetical protein EYF80_057783 [Liparis tanakae]